MPGVYVLQLVDDRDSENTYAFVIFVAHGIATVQNFIGPIKKSDWPRFYNDVGVLGSTRPGGFWCDGITEETPGGKGFSPPERPHYGALESRCPRNPHALLPVPSDERLASGPRTPGPPPPDITGFVQVVDTQTLGGASRTTEPRGMMASLHPFVEDPAGCQRLDPNDVRLKALGTYVQRAVDAVNILGPSLK